MSRLGGGTLKHLCLLGILTSSLCSGLAHAAACCASSAVSGIALALEHRGRTGAEQV